MQKPAEDTRSVRLLRGSERNAYKDKNKKAHAQKLCIKLKKKTWSRGGDKQRLSHETPIGGGQPYFPHLGESPWNRILGNPSGCRDV